MEFTQVSELVERLGSDEDAVRKMAVFKLQSNIGDPSFAEVFMCEGGLNKLRYLALHATGNTLAYSLTSFSRLLEVDKGWEYVDQELVERVGHHVVSYSALASLIPAARLWSWWSLIPWSTFFVAPCPSWYQLFLTHM